jgi:2-polyprenyl-3-methyl-5-hydroxy-6-metoxy-1,4-benzoquinol methylase
MGSGTEVWDRLADRYAAQAPRDVTTIHYGRRVPTDAELRLVPRLEGKRVLDLGCGPGHNAVAAALQGAHVIALDAAPAMIANAKDLADEHGVRVEWRIGDLAELAWLRADSVDVALAIGVLAHVEDLDRVLRQVHRVLRTGGVLVFDHPHPFALSARREIEGDGALPLGRYEVHRSYFERAPIEVDHDGEVVLVHPRTVSMILSALARAGYAVDVFLEPEPVDATVEPILPAALVVKARKLGS